MRRLGAGTGFGVGVSFAVIRRTPPATEIFPSSFTCSFGRFPAKSKVCRTSNSPSGLKLV